MSNPSPTPDDEAPRLAIDAGGAVKALEVGAGSTAVAGLLAGVAANVAAPIAVVAGLPIAFGLIGAALGYRWGAKAPEGER